MRETVNQPRKWSREYQTYYRDPVTRKFVPITGLVVKLEKDLKSFQLSGGIPSLSYRGNKIWQK